MLSYDWKAHIVNNVCEYCGATKKVDTGLCSICGQSGTPKNTMTKLEEIMLLRNAIIRLGPDSYLGPWLQSVVGEVEQMIKSDIFPDLRLSETAKRVKDLQEFCARDCEEQKRQAAEQCKKMYDSNKDECLRIREQLRNRIQAVLTQI